MNPKLGKWGKVALVINAGKVDVVERDGPACKYKWSTLLSDFKKIWDFHQRTGRNSEEYFEISFPEKKEHKLPKTFFVAAYRNMAEWLKDKATLNPPHMRDTSDPNDHNYSGPAHCDSSQGMQEDGDGFGAPAVQYAQTMPDLVDSTIDLTSDSTGIFSGYGGDPESNHQQEGFPPQAAHTASTAEFRQPAQPSSPAHDTAPDCNTSDIPRSMGTPPLGTTARPPRPRTEAGGAQPSALPKMRPTPKPSSSTNSGRKSTGSTGQKRRSTTQQKLIVDGVITSSEKLVHALQEINQNQVDIDKQKLELHRKQFEDRMVYDREKDKISQDNARLSLMNQNMVVQAIANLATAISRIVQPAPAPYHSSTSAPTDEPGLPEGTLEATDPTTQ
jgi:hypothetical protein